MAGLSFLVLLLSAVTVAVMASSIHSAVWVLPINWTLATSCFQALALLCATILFSHARDCELRRLERIAARVIAALPVLLLLVALIHDLFGA
jgi:hypothetical protein